MYRYRMTEYNTEEQPTDPISACTLSLVTDIGGIGMAIADMPRELFKSMSQPKKKNSTQGEAQDAATPLAPGSETSLPVPQGNESEKRSTPAPSIADTETLDSTVPTTAHSNTSQPTLSDTASSVSRPWSPGQSSTQGSVNDK